MPTNLVKKHQEIILKLEAKKKHFEQGLFRTVLTATKTPSDDFRSICSFKGGELSGFNAALVEFQKCLDVISKENIDPKYHGEMISKDIKKLKETCLAETENGGASK